MTRLFISSTPLKEENSDLSTCFASCLCCLAYNDLVLPLKKSCPEALNAVNNAGVTPEDLLTWMKRKEVIIDTLAQREYGIKIVFLARNSQNFS